jgi:hypothetical protein
MSLKINYKGQMYESLEAMPPEAREAYQKAMALLADQNGNGVPDLLDGLLQGQSPEGLLKPLTDVGSTFTQVAYNGQMLPNVEAMPEEARRAYEQAMRAMDQNNNGIPDALERGAFMAAAPLASGARRAPAAPLPSTARPLSSPYTPAGLEPEGASDSARRLRTIGLAALGLALVVFVAAVILVAVFVLPNLLGAR